MNRTLLFSLCVLCGLYGEISANPPTAAYIFPAGAQRGTSVEVRVGGLFLHDRCDFDVTGPGLSASPYLTPAKRVWFEGPVLPLPESQRQEDYPADMHGKVTLAKDAPLGSRRVRVFTAQGGAGGPVFVVGDLPEVVEQEIAGDPLPKPIKLPVVANGRIFPYEDIDLWEFDAQAGQTVTAFVHAKSINSPLTPKLDILDAKGNVVAEQMLHACVGTDASVKFTPKAAGKYRVRITDANTNGGQAFVYRLTVTADKVPQFHFPLKARPDGLKDVTEAGASKTQQVPVALNGQIERPGVVGVWKLDLKKTGKYVFDLQAKRYESPLCGVVRVLDATGKELAKIEGTETNDPGALAFSPPADGVYTVQVAEKFRRPVGPEFVYRLRVLGAPEKKAEPGFRLTMKTDVFTISRGATVPVPITVERFGGFNGPIKLEAENLPKGVTVKKAGKTPAPSDTLVLEAAADAVIGHAPLVVTGDAIIGDKPVTHTAIAVTKGQPDEPALKLAVALPTPFKIVDQYVMTSAPRGETYYRKYKVDRGTFDGPIQISLADKQARHLQGVTGPTLTLKPGETEFEYPAFLPPWMELGRTCRVCVMATAKVKDPVDGREHTVSFSSVEQNQQMIVVVGPGRLDIAIDRTSIRAEGEVRLPLKISRSKTLAGLVSVEVVLPEHVKGVTAAKLVVAADKSEAELVLKFAPDAGPFNVPLLVRATVKTPTGPVTAETKVEAIR